MATGFTGIVVEEMRYFKGAARAVAAILLFTVCVSAIAANVTTVGLFYGKAVVVINLIWLRRVFAKMGAWAHKIFKSRLYRAYFPVYTCGLCCSSRGFVGW